MDPTPDGRPPRLHPGRTLWIVGGPSTTHWVARLLAPMTERGWDVTTPHHDIRSAAQALRGCKVDLLVVDLAVIVDNEDLGWLRQILLWPSMPRAVLLARGPGHQARVNALRPLGGHYVIPSGASPVDVLTGVRDAAESIPQRPDPRLPHDGI